MPEARERPGVGLADILVGASILAVISMVIGWATHSHPYAAESGQISLVWWRLPLDALYSWLRMAAAYVVSLIFTLIYAYVAAFNRRAEKILIPLLDILQSIPVLSFLPVVLLAFIALFPGSRIGVNLAAIILIFTGQVWNMVFATYHGFITIPRDLRESALSLNLSAWQRFRTMELPYAMVGLVWNSMMSWAGGWFFLMACEMFSLGNHSYQLQGLGSYLQTAANQGRWGAELAGLVTLVLVIVLMDQLIWRPLLAWADKFKMEMVESADRPRSTVLRVLRRSLILEWMADHIWYPLTEWSDRLFSHTLPRFRERTAVSTVSALIRWLIVAAVVVIILTALEGAVHLLSHLNGHQVLTVVLATLATLSRVVVALFISVLWTVPVGVFIGLNRKWAARLTPVTQIAASVPATALFPGLVAILLHLNGGLNTAAVLLMVLGTQWYILFNVIAGASAIPEDLREATRMFRLSRAKTWSTLILPSIAPFLITGLITAAGGAWNASIVAEYVSFHGHTYTTFGVGSIIAQSSQHHGFPILLLATAMLALTVVLVNRLVWRRLYNKAAERYSVS
ncbi:ABC transporter permease [Sulfobacillus harzensis]|uniref:ABC transporter permease subunit n=1 Tax=Sulfobacillus harzensis TaxID=2729629 RepID=A0A7Y0Q190_9FIRM|nr:ABC transporter permease subunit [Sulfobacillus harzensis]NMP21212.1 ABC transporter permease subunit [Sulfobacillus harzensis]